MPHYESKTDESAPAMNRPNWQHQPYVNKSNRMLAGPRMEIKTDGL